MLPGRELTSDCGRLPRNLSLSLSAPPSPIAKRLALRPPRQNCDFPAIPLKMLKARSGSVLDRQLQMVTLFGKSVRCKTDENFEKDSRGWLWVHPYHKFILMFFHIEAVSPHDKTLKLFILFLQHHDHHLASAS